METDVQLVEAVVERRPGPYERMQAAIGRVVRACLADVVAAAPWLRAHEADLFQAFELLLLDDDFRVLRIFAG